MNEKELKPMYQELLNVLPNYVREQIELCLYHNDSTYHSLIADDTEDDVSFIANDILSDVIRVIAKMILDDADESEVTK